MKKKNTIRKNSEFQEILKKNKPINTKHFRFYIVNKKSDFKFGIVISKKITNAANRNLIKRRIKSIIDKNEFNEDFNCIIMCKKEILNTNYDEIKSELNIFLKKKGLVKEEN